MTCESCNRPLNDKAIRCPCGWKKWKGSNRDLDIDLSNRVPVDVGGRITWMEKPYRLEIPIWDQTHSVRMGENIDSLHVILHDWLGTGSAKRGRDKMVALAEKYPAHANGFVEMAKEIGKFIKVNKQKPDQKAA